MEAILPQLIRVETMTSSQSSSLGHGQTSLSVFLYYDEWYGSETLATYDT